MVRIALLLAVVLSPVSLLAEESPPEAKPAEKVSPEVEHWVQKLSDPDATVRDEAVKKLTAIGKDAVDAVAAAALADNLETITRCISVLAELYKSKDEPTKEAATAALRKLAESRNRSAARRAQAIVGGGPGREPDGPAGRRGFGAPQNFGNRVSVRTVNGDVHLQASEDGREIEISKKATGEIEMKVTEPGEKGKPGKTSTYTARDEAELKKAHPEAATLYEKFMSRGAHINIRLNGPAMRRFGPPNFPFPVLPIPDPEGLKPLVEEMSAAQEQVKKCADTLKELAKSKAASPEELQKLAIDLDAAVKRLDAARDKLEKLFP